MDQLLTPLFSFLLLYKYAALFAVIFVSNIIFVIPSNIIIIIAGVFSGETYFNFYWSLLTIVIGNSLGDFIIYSLAKKHYRWLDTKLQSGKLPFLNRLKRFIKSAAGRTILISRSAGSLAVVVNFLAGLAQVSWWKFLFYDVVGNLVVGAVLLYVGFVAGAAWDQASDVINIIGVVIAVLVAAFFVYKAVGKNKK